MVPHATTISTGNVVVTQAPIGTPLSFIPILSLPHGYHPLNTSIPIPTKVPFGVSRIFFTPGYNVSFSFLPTPSQVLSEGYYPPFVGRIDPYWIQSDWRHLSFGQDSILVIRFLLEGNLTLEVNLNLGSNSNWGTTFSWRTTPNWRL
jgi:hypothetical protein